MAGLHGLQDAEERDAGGSWTNVAFATQKTVDPPVFKGVYHNWWIFVWYVDFQGNLSLEMRAIGSWGLEQIEESDSVKVDGTIRRGGRDDE